MALGNSYTIVESIAVMAADPSNLPNVCKTRGAIPPSQRSVTISVVNVVQSIVSRDVIIAP